jgi:hypothetical protein
VRPPFKSASEDDSCSVAELIAVNAKFNNPASTQKTKHDNSTLKKSMGGRLRGLPPSHPARIRLFALSQRAQGVVPPPDGGYPALRRQKNQGAFKASPPASQHSSWLVFALSNAVGSFNTVR